MLDTATLEQFEDATGLLDDPSALRRRAEEDGCVLFRGLLPAEPVLALRRAFIAILIEIGWLKPGTDPQDIIAGRSVLTEGDPEFRPAFDRFQSLPEFHKLAHHPNIIAALEKLFGERVLVHPRNIGRIMFPDTPWTPPHQDFLHVRGTPNTWTAWIPLGDVPAELGGLVVWHNSHRKGLLPVVSMAGAGGSGIEEENRFGRPTTAEYRAGDVIFLHGYAVHSGSINRTGNRMRLSVDYRYQPMSEPVDASSLKPHMGWFDWDFVYRNWPKEYDGLRYYWKDLPLNVVDFRKSGKAITDVKGGY